MNGYCWGLVSKYIYLREMFQLIKPPANKVWGVYRNPPVRPSVCLSVCLFVCLSVCLSVRPSVRLSVRPSMYLVSATPPKRLIGFL